MKSYAENQEDVWVHDHLPVPQSGFYVDVGAAWPDRYSQTAFLRELGWKGLAIDANPAYREFWEGVPAEFVCAVVSDEPEINFLIEPSNAQVSRKHATGIPVTTRRLDDILDERGVTKVDFLAVDVEDHELNVVKSIDLERFGVNIIVAEFNSEHAGQNFSLMNYLVGTQSYRVMHLSSNNAVYYRP